MHFLMKSLFILLALGGPVAAQTDADLLNSGPDPDLLETSINWVCDAPSSVREHVTGEASKILLPEFSLPNFLSKRILKGVKVGVVTVLVFNVEKYCENLKPSQPTFDLSGDPLRKLEEKLIGGPTMLDRSISIRSNRGSAIDDYLLRALKERGLTQ
jgi:hypothetical protein